MCFLRPLVFPASVSLILLTGLTLWPSEGASAEGFRQRRKREEAAVQGVQTFQPPPADSLALYCEPIRQEAVQLAQKPVFVRWAYEPRRLWLIRRHTDCTSRLMEQEYTYLKHVDIQQAPHLPTLKLDEASPDASDKGASDKEPTGKEPADDAAIR
jgi:hypothetical protein